jgi:signal transduction histidine kinase/ligand-binding sensor domain-containing protein
MDLKIEKVIFDQHENTGTVYCIFKDKQGFIWLGTSTGLHKFDGVNLKSYRYNPADSLSISSNEVRSIQEDKNGDLWIGTINKGINKFVRREEKFVRYDKSQKGNYFLREEIIPQLIYTNDNQLWACVWGAGLAYFDEKINKFEYIFPDSSEISSTLSKHIRSIHQSETDPNIFFVGTRQGLMKFDRRAKKYFPLFENDIASGTALSGFIFSIIEGKNNTLWLGSQNKGFCNFNPVTEQISQYGLKKNTGVLSLAKDNNGNIWIGSAGDGIFYFDLQQKSLTNFQKQENISGSLPSNVINSLFVCDEDIVWIGTAGSGLSRYTLSIKKFQRLLPINSNVNFTKDSYVSHIFEDENKKLWLCGEDGDIFIYDTEIKNMKPLFANLQVRPHKKIYSVINVTEDKYLIASFGDGFFVYDKASKRIYNKKIYPEHSDILRANKVTSFLKLSESKFLVGTDGGGLFEYDIDSDELKLFSGDTPNVWALLKDKSNNIWIGTWGSGLFRLNLSDSTLQNFHPKDEYNSSFNSLTAVCITQDYQGNLWFGTQGDGVLFLAKDKIDNPKFTNYNSTDGIPGDLIMGIAASDTNDVWISTQAGLASFNYKTESFTSYGLHDGIEQVEFNLGSILKASEDNLYFGSLEGVYVTNRNSFRIKQKNFNTVLTDIRILNNPVKFFSKEYPSTEYEKLELSYNQNFISFEFAPLNFSNNANVICEYMIEKVDNNWVSDEGRRFASYTDLSPGRYKFIVRSFDAENNLINSFSSIEITIHPPVWATWYAYTFYGLLFLSALLLIRKYELEKRVKKVKERLRRNKEESEIKEMKLKAETAELKAKALEQQKEIEKQKIRIRIAQDLHDEIGSNLSSISLMSELIQEDENINAEASDKIKRIHKVAKGSTQAMRDIVWLTNPSSDSLKDIIAKMKEVADNTLGKFALSFDYPKALADINLLPETKRNIFFIYKEALNNIVKHAEARSVEIKFDVLDGNIFLLIKDDGKGFSASASSGGNGLKNIRSRAKEINADLKFESTPGKGTLLELTANITQMRD